jgi:hypothetical protein
VIEQGQLVRKRDSTSLHLTKYHDKRKFNRALSYPEVVLAFHLFKSNKDEGKIA